MKKDHRHIPFYMETLWKTCSLQQIDVDPIKGTSLSKAKNCAMSISYCKVLQYTDKDYLTRGFSEESIVRTLDC